VISGFFSSSVRLALDCEGGNFLALSSLIFWFISFSGYWFFKKMFFVFNKALSSASGVDVV
jgi:hypothetical protein